MVRSRGYHYESSLLTCTVKEGQNRRFLLRRFILLWWDLLFTTRRFVLLRYKLQINLRYNTIFWNTYKWLLIIILRERVVWRAIFSFVISFEISKLTSSFVNFNDLTKLISVLGMAKNQVRNISANHCARRVLGAVLKLKKYFVSSGLRPMLTKYFFNFKTAFVRSDWLKYCAPDFLPTLIKRSVL